MGSLDLPEGAYSTASSDSLFKRIPRGAIPGMTPIDLKERQAIRDAAEHARVKTLNWAMAHRDKVPGEFPNCLNSRSATAFRSFDVSAREFSFISGPVSNTHMMEELLQSSGFVTGYILQRQELAKGAAKNWSEKLHDAFLEFCERQGAPYGFVRGADSRGSDRSDQISLDEVVESELGGAW